LDTIKDLLSLLGCLLDLILGRGVGQSPISGVEILLQFFVLLFQHRQLCACVLVFPEGSDGLTDLFRINLSNQIDCDDDRVSIKGGTGLSVEYNYQSGRVGADLIPGKLHPIHNRDALQVGCNLFERVPLGRFGGKANCILPRVTFPHPMLPLSRHDPEFGSRR
jgi:hypothetical protein